ncbi:MAG: hypothetical protein JW950_05665, partial [Deltaproteobacteria bacterium]|nr:hypothetical protein [Deltaproteobacteria bacterium]
ARTRFDPDDLPCVVVWPQEETAENKYGRSRHVMPVNIEGLMNFGSGDPSVIGEQMLGDLIKCFTDQAWVQTDSPAHFFESIEYAGGGTSAPYEGDKTVAAVARFNVVYWTAIGDPYSQ